jgi:DNA invertase Pin-like site-specific DNA recombinase
LGQHILSFTSGKAQILKDEIVVGRLARLFPLLLSDGGTQSSLASFSGSGPDSINEPAPADSESESDNPSSEVEALVGLIYARVSSDGQRDGEANDNEPDEGSIKGQIEEMEKIAQQEGIDLPYDPITDEAETGTDFDRQGIQQVFETVKRRDIDYLLVEKVDRIGRSAPETLYFIHVLQSKCGVTLITSTGEKDISERHGLMHATLMSLLAEVQNDLRVTKTNKERIRGFLKKKNWKCRSPKIPLGYDETSEGWLEVNVNEKPIVRDLFRKFAECENYAATERYIDHNHESGILEGHKLKTVLQNRVYIGEPRVPEEWLDGTMYKNNLEEPELHLLQEDDNSPVDVTEDVFHEVQEIIEKKESERDDSEVMTLSDFIEEFSLFSVIQGTNAAKLQHHCGEALVKDGQVDLKGNKADLDGNKVHRYKCRKCEEKEDPKEYYRRWPKKYELDAIRQIQEVIDGESSTFVDK